MDALILLDHAIAWARDHGYGVAREVADGFVAVMPDGRHSRHRHFYEALEWLDLRGVRPNGAYSLSRGAPVRHDRRPVVGIR